MNLNQLLEERKTKILSRALGALMRAHLDHHEKAGPDKGQERLEALYDLIQDSVKTMDQAPLIGHVDNAAQERFLSGFELQEVQTAFNVLEESIWKEIVQELPAPEIAGALGLVNMILRSGKDVLSHRYVKLATKTKATSLNIPTLYSFSGYENYADNTLFDSW